jgi:hypothetical protein
MINIQSFLQWIDPFLTPNAHDDRPHKPHRTHIPPHPTSPKPKPKPKQDLEELRGWVVLEEPPPTANGPHGHAPHEAEPEPAIEPPPSVLLPPPAAMGQDGEDEPIRVRRTADPLVLHVWFGFGGGGGGGGGGAGAVVALGPPAFAVRVPRFYPHSVRVMCLYLILTVSLSLFFSKEGGNDTGGGSHPSPSTCRSTYTLRHRPPSSPSSPPPPSPPRRPAPYSTWRRTGASCTPCWTATGAASSPYGAFAFAALVGRHGRGPSSTGPGKTMTA